MMYTRYFEYQSDNEPAAIDEIKMMIEKEGLKVDSISCASSSKAEDTPEDWFDDYVFIIEAKIDSDLSEDEIEEKLSNIAEYSSDYTDINSMFER